MWNGVYADIFFPCLAGFQGLIPLFRFPSIASCSRQANNFCAKWATDFGKISHLFWVKLARFLVETGSGFRENLPPTFGKSVVRKSATEFEEIRHRFCGNLSPTLGKWATDFRKINRRLWENQPPTLGKWATDFGKISRRLSENEPPTLGKSATDFGEMGSGDAWKFETNCFKKYL